MDFSIFRQIKRGVEKENLRATLSGDLAMTPHPDFLGKPLTNPWMTLDFSESQMEMVTPAENKLAVTYQQLSDINTFAAKYLKNELLWPNSMPCPLPETGEKIPLANFGHTNKAKMREVYRKGLCHRYGRKMQAISGIHYNFSLPEGFFSIQDKEKNDVYFSLIRNALQYMWLIPYLFGASPACDQGSLIKKIDYVDPWLDNDFISPFGTSLRLSDLGYQNKGRDLFDIQYDNLENYAEGLLKATQIEFPEYQKIGVFQGGEYRQISDKLLQIENEYYNPVRPKQVISPCERPVSALFKRGVAYVELRLLDLNPLSSSHIDQQTMAFLDIFFIFCAMQESTPLSKVALNVCHENLKRVAIAGRDPKLNLVIGGREKSFTTVLKEWFENVLPLVEKLDKAIPENDYLAAFVEQKKKVDCVDLTPSAQVLHAMQQDKLSFRAFNVMKSKQYRNDLPSLSSDVERILEKSVKTSIMDFEKLEAKPQIPFSEYLKNYFKR